MAPTVLCFILPLSVAIELGLAGGVFLAELVTPCVAAGFLVFQRTPRVDQRIRLVAQLGAIYLVALVISDMWNGSSFDQYSRGWARLVVFFLNLASIYVLIDLRRARLIAFTLGLAAGRLLLAFPSYGDQFLNWKIGLAKPAALIAVVACVALYHYRSPLRRLAPAILAGLAIYNLLMDFRSLAGVLMATAVILFASDARMAVPQERRRSVLGRRTVTVIGVCGVVAGLVTYQLYHYAATAGWLGDRATSKFETQAEATDLPLLLAGRNELLVSLEAILDAPLLGHGSWPENRYYADKIARLRYDHRLNEGIAVLDSDLIPTHSHLFGGWVEAGLAGGVFWTAILWLSLNAIARSYQQAGALRPLYLYGAILLIWDILFSPFSGFRRLETAYLLIVSLRGSLQRRRQRARRSLRRRSRRRTKRRTGPSSVLPAPQSPLAVCSADRREKASGQQRIAEAIEGKRQKIQL